VSRAVARRLLPTSAIVFAAAAAVSALVVATPAAGEPRAAGKKVIVADSDYGPMLWTAGRQALYIFARDRGRGPTCYGDCARAWPPLFTRGKPIAGAGVRPGLLGTVRRRGGARQVTYNGKPLYTYAHEEPGEVLCHNVNLNGGLWWVIGPNGKRRP
jgi:predicted lipoprotein with Yx(FWY)xxD motif